MRVVGKNPDSRANSAPSTRTPSAGPSRSRLERTPGNEPGFRALNWRPLGGEVSGGGRRTGEMRSGIFHACVEAEEIASLAPGRRWGLLKAGSSANSDRSGWRCGIQRRFRKRPGNGRMFRQWRRNAHTKSASFRQFNLGRRRSGFRKFPEVPARVDSGFRMDSKPVPCGAMDALQHRLPCVKPFPVRAVRGGSTKVEGWNAEGRGGDRVPAGRRERGRPSFSAQRNG